MIITTRKRDSSVESRPGREVDCHVLLRCNAALAATSPPSVVHKYVQRCWYLLFLMSPVDATASLS